MWYVRSFFIENGVEVALDEGPWDHTLAELIIADIGVDASIPRGLDRQKVERAILIPESEVRYA